MSDTVMIPADVAKAAAPYLREASWGHGASPVMRKLVDLLDPPPLTLRERVARALAASDSNPWDEANHSAYFVNADAAILEISSAIELLPSDTHGGPAAALSYRASVLDFLDGGFDD
jgi:hypothetical protein